MKKGKRQVLPLFHTTNVKLSMLFLLFSQFSLTNCNNFILLQKYSAGMASVKTVHRLWDNKKMDELEK